MKFLFFILFIHSGHLEAQSYKEEYEKCSRLLEGKGVGDSIYWKMIRNVHDCMKGKNAPDFKFRTLSGDTLSLSGLKGQVIVINFWNTLCAPCIAEMPALNEIVDKYKGQGVVFISATYESEQTAKDFLSKRSFNFQHAGDAEKIIVEEFLTDDIYPYSMIIDRQGKVSKILLGGSDDREETLGRFVASIDACLGK